MGILKDIIIIGHYQESLPEGDATEPRTRGSDEPSLLSAAVMHPFMFVGWLSRK